MDHNKLWKILKEKGILNHLTCLLRSLYAGQEATGPYMKKLTGSKLGREYIKAVYCHLAYLTYMQSTVLSRSVMSVCLWPKDCSRSDSSVHGESPGKNTGVCCHALLQKIFPIQGLNPGLPYCWQILYCLHHQGGPRILEWGAYPFSRGSFQPRDWTKVSCISGRFFTSWATREAQSTSCKMSGWMNHKLESRLPGETSTASDMQMILP